MSEKKEPIEIDASAVFVVVFGLCVLMFGAVGAIRWYKMPYDAPAHVHEGEPGHSHPHSHGFEFIEKEITE